MPLFWPTTPGGGLCNSEGKRNSERAKACKSRSIYAKAGKRDSTQRLLVSYSTLVSSTVQDLLEIEK